MYTYKDLTVIKDEMMKMDKNKWKEICVRILIPNEEKITINQSGVWFCMLSLSEKTIDAIKEFLVFTEKTS
jgi:hypothetical protein